MKTASPKKGEAARASKNNETRRETTPCPRGRLHVVATRATASLPIRLNDRWRVADDPLQWILQQRKAKEGSRRRDGSTRSGWRNRRFPTTRDLLKRDIAELCGEVEPAALAQIEALPEVHPGFAAYHAANMRQYWRDDPAALRRYIERYGHTPPELREPQ